MRHKKHGARDLQQNFCVFLFRNTINRSKLSRKETFATRDSLAPNYYFCNMDGLFVLLIVISDGGHI